MEAPQAGSGGYKMRDGVQVLVDRLFREKVSWPELIKQIRAMSGVGILMAEQIALSHDGWRRLCSYRIKHEAECRKQTAWHIKFHGANSLVALIDEEFVVLGTNVS